MKYLLNIPWSERLPGRSQVEFDKGLFVVYSMQVLSLINISRMAYIRIYEQKGTRHTVVVYKVWITSHLSTCPQMVLRTCICGIVGWSRYKKTAISGEF